MKLTKSHYIVFSILFTEYLGFSLILPFLPLYAEQFNASPFLIGLVIMSFSLTQFFSSPILGKLSDHYGRKPLLVLSQVSTFISFIILGFANSIFMIFISRLIDGLIGSNSAIAKAYLFDISSKKDRSEILGLKGAIFGLAYLFGPAIGGILSAKYGYSLPSFIAAGFTLITVLLSIYLLSEKKIKRKKLKLSFKIFNLNNFQKFFSKKNISSKLWQLFVYIIMHGLLVSMFSLYAKKQLSLTPIEIGYLLSIYGITTIIVRGFLLNKLIVKFTESKLIYVGFFGVLISLFILTIPSKLLIYSGIILFSICSSFIGIILQSDISKKVSKNSQGSLMGVISALNSISQIIAPLVGGFILNYFIPANLLYLCMILMIIIIILKIKEN